MKQTSWESDYIKKIYETRRPRRRSPVFLLSALFLFIVFSAFLGFTLAIFSKFILFETLLTLLPGEKLLSETNILVMGLDSGEQIHRSDTIMVVHINPLKNQINVVSIPRDTIVPIPGHGPDKINHAFAFGGAELSRSTVEQFLGIKIPYYVSINMRGLAQLIDEIGGVTVDVEKRMFYADYSQSLFVDLQPGPQKLSGSSVLSYLRYRSDGGDLNRILRHQRFIKALAGQILKKENILRSPQLLLKLMSFMDSNLSTRDIIGLAVNMRKIYEFGEIKMSQIQGYDSIIDGVYYMHPDAQQVQKIVDLYLKGS